MDHVDQFVFRIYDVLLQLVRIIVFLPILLKFIFIFYNIRKVLTDDQVQIVIDVVKFSVFPSKRRAYIAIVKMIVLAEQD